MHTIEEAKELWCPHARVFVKKGGELINTGNCILLAVNNSAERPRCIADKCAMWKWESLAFEKTGKGYCGLAGRE